MIQARETITFTSLDDGLREVVFDCGDLTVDSVLDRTRPVPFEQRDHQLHIRLVEPLHRGQRRRNMTAPRPLVFLDWNHPTVDDRTIVYQKGAYFLHVLRVSVGDEAFWTGVRQYTIEHAGGSVRSGDFQKAMESASGRDLSSIFAEWVYPKRP